MSMFCAENAPQIVTFVLILIQEINVRTNKISAQAPLLLLANYLMKYWTVFNKTLREGSLDVQLFRVNLR